MGSPIPALQLGYGSSATLYTMVRRLTLLGAWCLLVGALSDPVGAIAHGLFPHDHGTHPAARHVEGPDEHDHELADPFFALRSINPETTGKPMASVGGPEIRYPYCARLLNETSGHSLRDRHGSVLPSAPRAPPVLRGESPPRCSLG